MAKKQEDIFLADGEDKSGMLNVIEKAPEQFILGLNLPTMFDAAGPVESIIISGMGGSAICGDIAADLYSDSLKMPLTVNRGYSFPKGISDKSLFIAISYSGETEETLTALKQAEASKMQIVCISSGGKLKGIARAQNYPFIELPQNYQPRAAFYIIFGALLNLLKKYSIIELPQKPIDEAVKVLEGLKIEIGQGKDGRTNKIKQIAQKIKDKAPIIFSTYGTTYACGVRLKSQLNENSKMPAFLSVLPESNHNEIVGYAALKKGAHEFAMILLRDDEENLRIKKRIEITKSLIGANLGGAIEIQSKGENRLARILSLAFTSDLLSCYVALYRGIDPTPVDIITKLKKELKR